MADREMASASDEMEEELGTMSSCSEDEQRRQRKRPKRKAKDGPSATASASASQHRAARGAGQQGEGEGPDGIFHAKYVPWTKQVRPRARLEAYSARARSISPSPMRRHPMHACTHHRPRHRAYLRTRRRTRACASWSTSTAQRTGATSRPGCPAARARAVASGACWPRADLGAAACAGGGGACTGVSAHGSASRSTACAASRAGSQLFRRCPHARARAWA